MTETEIERLVVRIVGDNTGLTKAYQQSLAQTKAVSGQMDKMGMTAGETRRSLMVMGHAGILPPEVSHGLMTATMGINLLKSGAEAATTSLGRIGGTMAVLAGGPVLAGIAALTVMFTRWKADWEKASQASGSALDRVTSGAATASEALAGVRANILTDAMKELNDLMGGPNWAAAVGNLQEVFTGVAPVEQLIDRLQTRLNRARSTFRTITEHPRITPILQTIALDQGVNSARELARTQQELAARSGLVERAAARMEAAQNLARRTGMSLADANIRIAASYDRIDAAGRRIDIGRMTLQLRELTHEADRAGLTETGQRIAAMAQEFMRANPGVRTIEEAFQRLGPILAETRTQLNRQAMGNFLRGIREQTAVMGLSSERAELHRMAMEGVADAEIRAALGAVKHMEAVKGLLAPLERLEGTRAGGAESLARIAEYQRAMSVAITTGTTRQQLLANQQSGQPGLGGLARTGADAAGAARFQADLLQVMRQIRDQGRPVGGPIPVPANLAGGGL